MGEINRALGASGAPIRLPIGDKTYLLEPLTKKVQGDFEEWLEERARRAAMSLKGVLPDRDYQKVLVGTVSDIAAGVYSFTSSAAQNSLGTVDGVSQLFLSMLRKHQPEMEVDDVMTLLGSHGEEIIETINGLVKQGKV